MRKFQNKEQKGADLEIQNTNDGWCVHDLVFTELI